MPRQAERTKPTTFDSFTDVRISTKSSSSESDSRNGTSLYTTEDDLDDDTRDRLGLLRRNQEVDYKGASTITSAGGGMKHGKPFISLSINSSSLLPIDGVINAHHDQIQQNAKIIAAQDEALDTLSVNLSRLQNITADITSEMTAQEVVIQEVSSIAVRAENAVNDVTRQVDGIVKRYNAESWIPRVIWGLICILIVEFFYLLYS